MRRRRPAARNRRGRDLADERLVRADVDAFGANEDHVGDTEEAEHTAQVCFLVVEERERCLRTGEAAARGGNDDPLAASEPLRSVLGVAESLPGDRKAVDPRLELRGNAEVVHRRPDRASWLSYTSSLIVAEKDGFEPEVSLAVLPSSRPSVVGFGLSSVG